VLGLDHYAPFVLSALGITVVVLGAYGLYLRSRLNALRRPPQSARNVNAAAPIPSTAQPARSANGSSTP
jgi:hypothetical protein